MLLLGLLMWPFGCVKKTASSLKSADLVGVLRVTHSVLVCVCVCVVTLMGYSIVPPLQ